MIPEIINVFLHLDQYFGSLINEYSIWIYLILFVTVFLETGVVVTPFLPGDSLLFLAGAFAAAGRLDIAILFLVFTAAAILGDTVNYWVGHHIGRRVLHEKVRFVKKEYVERTYDFYEKHGGKTIVAARFIPIIRTFAPFVAGIARMNYSRFLFFNVTGAVLWVASFLALGYYFGSIPFIKENLGIAIIAIVFVTVLYSLFELYRNRKK